MSINVQATGVELTNAMKEYAIEKMETARKYFDNIQKIDIDIGMRSHHHNKGKIYYAEVNVFIPKQVVRVVKDAEDLYKAIDKVKDHLKVELEKIKGKMRHKDKDQIRSQKEYQM